MFISITFSSFINSGLCFTSDTATPLCFIRHEASQAPPLNIPVVSEWILLRDVGSGAV